MIFFTFLLYSTTPQQRHLVGKRGLDIVLTNGKRSKYGSPIHPHPPTPNTCYKSSLNGETFKKPL